MKKKYELVVGQEVMVQMRVVSIGPNCRVCVSPDMSKTDKPGKGNSFIVHRNCIFPETLAEILGVHVEDSGLKKTKEVLGGLLSRYDIDNFTWVRHTEHSGDCYLVPNNKGIMDKVAIVRKTDEGKFFVNHITDFRSHRWTGWLCCDSSMDGFPLLSDAKEYAESGVARAIKKGMTDGN